MIARLQRSIEGVTRWVESHDYKAYDPGDGNMSFLRSLTFDSLFLQRLLTAGVLRAPFNIRPWIGIRPHRSTKGTGYMAWGYVKMFALTRDESYRHRAVACLDWLIENKSPGYSPYCWGNHFDFCTRGGKSMALTPIMPWSTLIGHAFLEAYETLGDAKYLDVASSVADWVLAVPREKTASGSCLSYVPNRQSSIHNANMLGAALLAQVGALTNNHHTLAVAKEAMTYSCSRQNPDGSWAYGAAEKYRWIDSFHTGYNLDSLKRYQKSSGDKSFDSQLHSGFGYFKKHFFEQDGRPKYYNNRTYPIDSQCAGQAIDTLTYFSADDGDALKLAQQVAAWTIEHLQDRDGHFYYRDLGWTVNKTPMLHWGQGVMFKALAHLLGGMEGTDKTPARRGGGEVRNGQTA